MVRWCSRCASSRRPFACRTGSRSLSSALMDSTAWLVRSLVVTKWVFG